MKRYHKTIKIMARMVKDEEGVDSMIEGVLKDIETQHGPVRLFDFKVLTLTTNYVPPRSEEYLTVIAESEE